MPKAENAGVAIHYEENGAGSAILFLHEYAGDHRSWEGQRSHFGARHRCVALSNRGYPGSDLPTDPAAYGQEIANADALAVLDRLEIERAHVVGLSMGAYTALQLAMTAPGRCLSVVAASVGSGSHPANRESFLAETRDLAALFDGLERLPAERIASGPTRFRLRDKNPEAWDLQLRQLAERDPRAAANTLRGVQAGRPSLRDLEDALAAVALPVLILVGDEDEACIEPSLRLKRIMPAAGLAMLASSGHPLNLEEPALFNRLVERFLDDVESDAWRPRPPETRPRGEGATALGLSADSD